MTVDTELDEMTVRGDRDRLTQVIANLCRNAIEALVGVEPPRRVLVCCRLAPSWVVIEVRDTGPGIPPDELASVFEPFRTTKSSGTGLGLSIARRIVEAHGGRLVVEIAGLPERREPRAPGRSASRGTRRSATPAATPAAPPRWP